MKESIKLALYGAGCTKEYAEKQTEALLKEAKDKILKVSNKHLNVVDKVFTDLLEEFNVEDLM